MQVSAVPEPSSYLMLGLGLGLIGVLRQRRARG
ncbi:PEP-CTERM sorting domain-containing protein [Rugamonas sp. DEMB1]|nr:PEP-CTERM sorting domain-containing protein [Rugamonas sp. DEMB1]WGG48670.1 PEP-CTERM sorting domain-containing protein [Rugamonas sp. DEMB1]